MERYFKALRSLQSIANYKLGDGSMVLFWSDLWNDNVLQIKFPKAIFLCKKQEKVSVSEFLLSNNIEFQFLFPY
jgi:hypothetical protein